MNGLRSTIVTRLQKILVLVLITLPPLGCDYALAGFGSEPGCVLTDITSLAVEPGTKTLIVGETFSFAVTGQAHGEACRGPITWMSGGSWGSVPAPSFTSEDATVLRLVASAGYWAEQGRVVAVGPGRTTFEVRVQDLGAVASVTVIPLPPVERFVSISAGQRHTCAVGTSGTAYCWGAAYGLGISPNGSCGREPCSTVPLRVAESGPFEAIATGAGFTCALAIDKRVNCWGGNTAGQLGDGTLAGHGFPREVAGDIRFTLLSVGDAHACGLSPEGRAYCWGSNQFGQLGDSSLTQRSVPTLVHGSLAFTSLSAGSGYTCGRTFDGEIFCWGRAVGAAGTMRISIGLGWYSVNPVPVLVASDVPFRTVNAGRSALHTCATAESGRAYCWGDNGWGQLGDGTTTSRMEPSPVVGDPVLEIAAPGRRFTCGLDAAGTVYCWGELLGLNSTVPATIAAEVPFEQLSVGSDHACALTVGGRAYCWGQNDSGRLGIGGADHAAVPTVIAGHD
jgi:alpha-tubulin suppressor-like RCC1 family protein